MNQDAAGDIFIRTLQSTINTEADDDYGISGQHNGAGDLTITLEQGYRDRHNGPGRPMASMACTGARGKPKSTWGRALTSVR